MLTDARLRKIKPDTNKKTPDKYSDTNGLQLHVFPTGRMTWIYAYRYQNKQRSLTLGSYSEGMTLAQARIKRDEAKILLSNGTDPNKIKKRTDAELNGENTFTFVAWQWHAKKSETWAESTKIKIKSRLEADILPYIGDMNINSIDAPELLAVIKRIESRSPDTAKRALQECGGIFRYGMAIGKNKHDPTIALKGMFLSVKQKHFASITEPSEVGGLLRAIDGFTGTFVVKCALQLAPMFFVRIGELRTAKWTDIDLENAEWRYFITKTKQNHIVPLSTHAVEILKELYKLTGYGEYVFTGGRDPKRPMSDGAINASLRRMGFSTQDEITGHGFRAMARTILHEQLGYDRDIIEHQLAHAVPDSLGTAYNRTKFLKQRKVMMQHWADYLSDLKQDVIAFPKGKRA